MDIKTLREEFATLHEQNKALINKVADEKNGQFSAEDTQEKEKRYSRMDTIRSMISEQEKVATYALQGGTAQVAEQVADKLQDKPASFSVDDVKRDLNTFARTGSVARSIAGTYGTDSGTQSGAFLPKIVAQPVEVRRLQNAFRALLGAYGVQPLQRLTPTAASLPVTDDSSVVGQAQTESATSGTIADPTYTGSITLNPTLYSSKQVWFSNTMVLAQDFDVMSYALPVLQKRVDKAQESAWTTTAKALTAGYTGSSATGVTYADLLGWEHSLKAAYRSDAGFIVSDSMYKALRGLVDSNNRPIMDLDPTNKFQATIHGKPVLVSDYLDAIGSGVSKKCGVFASADAVKIMDVLNDRLARYVNVPQYPDQTGFELFTNGDCGFVTAGVSLFVTAAS